MKKTLALFALAAACAFAQTRAQTTTLTAAGTTTGLWVESNYHTVQVVVSGSPSACTVRLEGSLDNSNWFDLSGTQTCTSSVMFHVDGKPATYARVNLLGAATTYTSAFDVFQSASNTAFQDTSLWKSASFAGGVVQANFATTGDNVNAAYTNLAVDGTTNTKVTSASYSFTSSDAGTDLYISAGTGWTVGSYHVNSISSGAAILDRSPAATSTTGGSFILGEIAVDICVATAP